MPTTSRTRGFSAFAAATLLLALALWAGLARDDGASATDSSRTTGPATEEPATPATGGDGAQGEKDGKKADRKGRRGDGSEGSLTPGTGATVPAQPVETEAAVPLDSVGDFGTGLKVRLVGVTSEQAEASAPGEIAGPAVRVSVDAVNRGDDPVSLDSVVVFVSYGPDQSPASEFGSLSEPLAGDLAPTGSRSGSYVYAVPPDALADLRVEISYTGSAPTVAFEGSVDG